MGYSRRGVRLAGVAHVAAETCGLNGRFFLGRFQGEIRLEIEIEVGEPSNWRLSSRTAAAHGSWLMAHRSMHNTTQPIIEHDNVPPHPPHTLVGYYEML